MRKRHLLVLGVLTLVLSVVLACVSLPDSRAAAGYACYYAEGNTLDGFREFITLSNPNARPINVDINYIYDDTAHIVRNAVPASARLTIELNGVVPPQKEVSLQITSASPFVAERPIYFNYAGYQGLTNSPRISALQNEFFFAEGNTNAGTQEWLCLSNPGTAAANATITFYLGSGAPRTTTQTLPAMSRRTVRVLDHVPANNDVSCKVSSNRPIAAERVQYFNFSGFNGGHISSGTSALTQQNGSPEGYEFAEGTTQDGFSEYLCLANPLGRRATATVTYYTESGRFKRSYTVAANSRRTLFMPTLVGRGHDLSCTVSCSSPLAVERPIYFNWNGISGGHVGPGASPFSPKRCYYFAEGTTRTGFLEYISVFNPNNSATSVSVYWLPTSGSLNPLQFSVPANRRSKVYVNQYIPAGTDHGAIVAASNRVVVENAMYCANQGSNGGDIATGVAADITGITIQPEGATLAVQETRRFTASIATDNGYPVPGGVTWSVQGRIGTINASGLFTATRQGRGYVVASARGISQRVAVRVEPPPRHLFGEITSPTEGAQVAGSVVIRGHAYGRDFAGYKVSVNPSDRPEEAFEIESSTSRVDPGGVLATWDARKLSGDYTIVLTVASARGNLVDSKVVSVLPTPPDITASITSPAPSQAVRGRVQVRGTAAGADFHAYEVAWAPKGTEDFTTVSFSSPVQDGVLLDWDTTVIPNGRNTLRLTVSADWGAPRVSTLEDIAVDNRHLDHIVIEPQTVTLERGEQCAFILKAYDEYGDETDAPQAAWSLLDPLPGQGTDVVGHIDENGLFTASGWGQVTVRADGASLSATSSVTVNEPTPAITASIASPGHAQTVSGIVHVLGTAAGSDFQSYEIAYAPKGTEIFTPTSSTEKVEDALLMDWDTASLSNGLYTLRLTVKAAFGLPVVVSVDDIRVDNRHLARIEILPDSLALVSGEAGTVQVRGFDQEGDNLEIGPAAFSMRDVVPGLGADSVGELVDNGFENRRIFMTTGWGHAAITATLGEFSAACAVTVSAPLARIEVDPAQAEVELGFTQQFSARCYDAAGEQMDLDVSWSCDQSVGTMDASGMFTATEYGSGTVTAVAADVSGSATVTVRRPARLEIEPAEITVEPSQQYTFTAWKVEGDGTRTRVAASWSCDSDVGQIEPSGLFSATGTGTSEVSASVGSMNARAIVHVPTYINESVLSGEVVDWVKKRNPYILLNPLTIASGTTLRVQPGVVVKALSRPEYSTLALVNVEGRVLAGASSLDEQGNEVIEPVYITSYKDDRPEVCGDTNADGSATMPAPGDWHYLRFENEDVPSALTNCRQFYGGGSPLGFDRDYVDLLDGDHSMSRCIFSDYTRAAIMVKGGSPSISECSFTNSDEGPYAITETAVQVNGGSPTVDACQASGLNGSALLAKAGTPSFTDNTLRECRTGVAAGTLEGVEKPRATITGNRIFDCATAAMSLGSSPVLEVSGNDGTGSGINGIEISGTYSTDVTWSANGRLPYVLTGPLTVARDAVSYATLTIGPGVKIKARTLDDQYAAMITVHGKIDSVGDARDKVITSLRDDSVCGDTNKYEGEVLPSTGDWHYVTFDNESVPSTLRGFEIKYGGGLPLGFERDYVDLIVDGRHTIDNCSFLDFTRVAVMVRGGAPVISGCDFTRSEASTITETAVRVMDGAATFRDCTVQGLTSTAFYATGGTWFKLEGNSISDCANGILIQAEAPRECDVVMTGNTVERCARGIEAPRCKDGARITDNTVRNCTASGISVISMGNDAEFSRNHAYDSLNGTAQLNVISAGSCGVGAVIDSNTARNCQGGILASCGAGAIVEGNTTTDCQGGVSVHCGANATSRQNVVTNSSGLSLGGGTESHIYGNHAYNSSGLDISGGDSSQVTDNTAIGCSGGIQIACGANVLMTRNHVTGCDMFGFRLTMSSSGAAFSGNTVESTTAGDGIAIGECGPATVISSNEVNDCSGHLATLTGQSEPANITFLGTVGAGNGFNGIEIGPPGGSSEYTTLRSNPVPYTLMDGDFVVGERVTLTLEASTVLKASNGHGVVLNGPGAELAADSTTLTSIYDDAGGKTVNAPQADKNPEFTDWAGITAQEETNVSINAATLCYGQTLLNLAHGVSLGDVSNLHVMNGKYDKVSGVHTGTGGVGIYFQGESSTSLHDSLLEWCDKAVLINEKAPHSGEAYPNLSGNNRFWSDSFGVYVDGVLSEQHSAINAKNNDWCDDRVFDYENGPGLAGDGSAVGVLGLDDSSLQLNRTIDWFPYSGLTQPYYKTDVRDRDWEHPTVGLYMNAGFNTAEMETMAQVFRDSGTRSKAKTYLWGIDEVYRAQLQNAETGGLDDEFLNTNNLAWVNSHGAIRRHDDGIAGVVCYGDYDLFADDDSSQDLICDGNNIRWGTGHLDWMAIDACRFMARDTQVDSRYGGPTGHDGIEGISPPCFDNREDYFATKSDLDQRYRHQTVDDGLHLLLGFANTANTASTLGGDRNCSEFARQITGQGGVKKSIVNSFFVSNVMYQDYDFRWDNYDLTTNEGEKEATWGPQGGCGSAIEWGAISVVYGATENMSDTFADETSMRKVPNQASATSMVKQSSDVPYQGIGNAEHVTTFDGPPRELELQDENGSACSGIDVTKENIFKVTGRYQWASSVPEILDDVLFGIPRGIYIEVQKVDGASGSPTDDPTLVINCNDTEIIRDVDGTARVKIPPLEGYFNPGDRFKMRIYNARTWYWGNANTILTVLPPTEQS